MPHACADGAGDNLPDNVRRIPPPGVAVPPEERAYLELTLKGLGDAIEGVRQRWKGNPAVLQYLPDVQIYYNAVHNALVYNEFFSAADIGVARGLLEEGIARVVSLHDSSAPWAYQTGLVVRGYISRIDGSVQPYGLVVPTSYRPGTSNRHRLDIWFHGRGENLSELNFIRDRERNRGEFTPADAFVLHPYGRYCNANRFAGEIDTLEALAHVRNQYSIDADRIAVRGFSMGGASCWQFATHYASDWAAAAPGAGFSETADFLKVFQKETLKPTWYEQKLWHWYDSADYAINLSNCPTVAYSGEKDSQKQAADVMNGALQKEGIAMVHVIGANAGHFYTAAAKEEINKRIDSIVARGRNPLSTTVHFTTWTLRYNRMNWITLDALEQHWERARVDATILDTHTVRVRTKNVTALTLTMPSGYCPLDVIGHPTVLLDGRKLAAPPVGSDRSWTIHFRKIAGRWTVVDTADDGTLRKRSGLQGPIDDAFLDSFLMVTPTGEPLNPTVGAWCAAEQAHAIEHWRRQFRGEARVKTDTEITPEDIGNNNLILWGDPASNKLLARIVSQLPIGWDAQNARVGSQVYESGRYVPVFIYPNPLNPKRYIVVNSGFTYREYDYLNNARQTPKLPDYAIVDTSVKPTSRAPGGIATAGFFDETWQIPAEKKR